MSPRTIDSLDGTPVTQGWLVHTPAAHPEPVEGRGWGTLRRLIEDRPEQSGKAKKLFALRHAQGERNGKGISGSLHLNIPGRVSRGQKEAKLVQRIGKATQNLETVGGQEGLHSRPGVFIAVLRMDGLALTEVDYESKIADPYAMLA